MFRIFLAAVALLALLAACGESGQDTRSPTPASDTPTAPPAAETPTVEPAPQTPTPTEPGGAGGGDLEGTVVPLTTPFPSPSPVSADWATYSDPRGRFTFSYPPTWFLDRSAEEPVPGGTGSSMVELFSYARSTWFEPYPPPNSTKVEIHSVPVGEARGMCDREGAIPASLGQVSGWQIVTAYDTSVDYPGLPQESKLSRIHQVAADHNAYRLCLIAYFRQVDPDEATPMQIVNSFTFAK